MRALSRVGKSEVASAASCVVRVPASPDGHDHPKEQVASRKDETNHAAQSLYEVPCRELQYLRPDRPFALRRDTDVAKEPQMVRPDRVLATMQGLFAACGVGVPSTDKLNDQKFVGNPRDGSGAWGSGAFAGARAQAMGFGLAFDIATGGVRLGLAKAIAEASLKSGECYDDRGDARIGRTSTKPGAKVESRTKDSESYAPSTVVIDHGDGMLTVRFVGKNRPTKRPTIVGEWMVRAREASKDDEPDDASAKRVKPVTLTQLVEGSAADERWRVRARRVAKKNKEKEKEKEKEKPAFVLAINADEKSVLVKFVDEFEVDQGKEKDEERGVVSKRVRKLGGWGRKTKKEVHRVGDGVEVLALEDYDDENEEEEDEAAGDDIAADSHINPDQRQLARGSVSIDGGTGKFLNYNSKRAMPVWKPASVAAVHPKDAADVDTTDPDQVTYDVEFGDRVWVKPELIYLDEDGSDVVKSVSTLVCAKKKADAPADDASPTDGAPEDDEAKTKASAPTLERDELLLVRLKIAMAASEMLNLDALVHAAAGVTLKSSDNDAIRGAWPADITQLAWLALVAKASARSLCASDACTIVAARDAFFGGACQDDDSDYAVAHDTHACNDAKRILGGMPALPYARGLVNAFVAVTQKPTYGDFSGGGFGRGGSGGGSLKLPYKLNESYKGQTGVSVTKEYPDGSVDLNIPGTPGESKVPRANVPGLPPFGAGGDGGDGAAGFEDTAVTAVGCDSFKVDLSRPLGADPTDAAAPSAIALHFGMGGYEFARALTARLVEFTELAGGSRSALPWDARNRAAFVTAAVDRANAAAIALPLPVPFTGGFAGGRLPPSVLFCESAAPVVPRTVEVSDDLRATVHVDATTKHLGVDGMALCAFANQPLAVAGVPPVGPTRTRVGAFIDVRPPEQSASERAVIEEVSTDRTTAVVRFADGTRRDDLDTKVLRLAPCALARVRLREDGGQPPREACVVAIDVDTGMCTVRFDEKTEHDAHMPLDDIVVCLDNDQRLPGGAAFEPGDIVDVPRATADPATSRLWVRGVVTDFVDDRKSDDDAGSAGGGGGDGIVPRYVRVMLACNRACIIDPVTATREPLSGEQRADINVLGGRARALADALLKHPLAALTTKAAAAGGDKELRESLDLLGKIAKDIGTSASDYVSQLRTDVFPPEDPKANDQSIIARGAEVDEAACKSCANLVSTCTRSGPDARALWLALEKHGGGAEEGEEDLLTMCTEMAANACDELDAFSASERAVLRDEIDATLAEANRSTALDDATRPDDEGTRKLALLLAAFEASAGNGSAVRLDDLITAFVRTETVAQLQSASRVAPPPCADVLRLRAPALDHATTVVLLRCVRLAQIGRAAQQAKVAEQDARDARTLLLRIVLTAESAQEVTEELIAHAAARRGISLHGAAAVVEAGVKLQKEVTKLACAHLGDDILKTPGPLSSPRGQHKSGHTAAARAHAKVANLACALTAWSPAGARHALHAHTPAAWRDALDAQRHKRLWCGQVLPKLGAMTAISVADARVNLLARLNTAQRAVKEFADILQTPRAVFKVHGERPTQPTSTFEQLTTTQRKWTFDPRVLVFELLTTFMVRQKQLELVENFLKTVKSGRSRVVQMIMGGGKTSVVSPLLGLMLADGKRLVSLIVPDSLLPQSKAEIQDKFVQILTKNVSEFRFVRTQGSHKEKLTMEDGYVEWAKRLRNARATRSIVCAGPSSMKALMLELVDVMQRLESVLAACADAAPPLPAAAVNEDAELEQYRARISKREAADAAKGIVVNKEDVTRQGGDERISCRDLEEEADALRNIIGLFGENGGVALIDEVDLILHPLKVRF